MRDATRSGARPPARLVASAGVVLGLLAAGTSAERLDLVQAYELALDNDPALQAAQAERDRVREATPQARASLLPGLVASSQLEEIRTDGTQIGFDPTTEEIGLIDFRSRLEATTFGVELRQPLFRWEALVGLDEARARVDAAEAHYRSALQETLLRVAGAYFEVLAAQEALAAARATREAFAAEGEWAELALEVGLGSLIEVEEARAAHDLARADEIAAERDVELAVEALQEILGVEVAELAPWAEGAEPSRPEPDDADAWATRALDRNLDLLAARAAAGAAGDRVRQARAAHLPVLDLVGSRRWLDQSGDNPFQIQDVTRDSIRLELSVPLFAGGSIRSRSREAQAAERLADEEVRLIARRVRRETREAFLGAVSDVARVAALGQAVRSTRTALEATAAGVEIGTRTMIDLVNARRTLAGAQTAHARARYDYLLNRLRLLRATGELDASDLHALERSFLAGAAGPGSGVAAGGVLE